MSAFSDYLENQILLWSFNGGNLSTGPGTVYISLHTGDPGETNTVANEVSGGNYGRFAATCNAGTWNVVNNVVNNVSTIAFPSSGTITGWKKNTTLDLPFAITHFAISTASSGGNVLYVGALQGGGKTVSAGDVFQFLATTGIQITLA